MHQPTEPILNTYLQTLEFLFLPEDLAFIRFFVVVVVDDIIDRSQLHVTDLNLFGLRIPL